jgi:PEP-CTERM motif
MIRYYPQLALLGLAVPALASVATPSAANSITDQLQLSSGGTTITITDNGAGDVNPIQGTINYVNSNFDGWEIELSAYTNSPDLGLGLTSLTANCVGWQCSTDPLSIAFGDINFAVPVNAGGFAMTYSATITGEGTTSQSAYFDNSNVTFGTTNLISRIGPLGAPSGGETATGATIAAVPDYSLTLAETFTDVGGGTAFSVDGNTTAVPEFQALSVDANLTAVPEPGALAIFGSALASLALIRRRKWTRRTWC